MSIRLRLVPIPLAFFLFLVGCGSGSAPAPSQARAATAADHGLELAAMDTSVAPGDDFFAYANGGWVKATEIPADRSTYGVFAQLREEADKRTSDLIQQVAAGGAAAGPVAAKIGDFYASYLDEAAIDAKGLTPLAPALEAITSAADAHGIARLLGSSLRADVDPLNNTNFHTDRVFGLFAAPDFSHPDRYVPYLLQGGLGMPDRDYYLGTDPAMTDRQTKYRTHIATVLAAAGIAGAEAAARRVYDLERRIATVHVSREDSADVLKANNPWTMKDFAVKAPGLDWTAFFQAAGLDRQPMVMVWQPGAVTGIAALVASQPVATWKDYLTFHAIDHELDVLPKPFRDERFAFYDQALTGAPKPRDRWKMAVAATNGALGDAVGKLYADRYFPAAAKQKCQAMVTAIVEAFSRRIDALTWMAPETKAKAKAKLKTLYVGIGYPDAWRDYSGLAIVTGEALANHQRSEAFDYHASVAKLGQPVNTAEWAMTPQTVNAVNLPLQNALNFPAAILAPPFFDMDADAALNYGGIGSVIGHEISHSFDDQGSQFDASGRLLNWWTPDDFKHFQGEAARLAAEFDAYEPLPGLHVNGKLTLSENIADVAGLSAAFDAWRASVGSTRPPSSQGLTPEQQFFIRFAHVHRFKARDAALQRQILTDGHAPDFYRADTVRNLDGWYDAFGVKPGQKMYLAPGDRVRVW